MEINIPDALSDSLREIGEIGGKQVYLVGGSVRDLLLKRPNLDIDIVVEGDAIRIAKEVQERWDGELQAHPQFGTATVTPKDPEKPKVDFVTARSETYQKPATLPKVEPGTVTEDLLRRDFSINALAMCIDADAFGTIIDKTGGVDDLNSGTIRVLHSKSYTDDPTRIFRACRYAGRYNFEIADADKRHIDEAVPLIDQLSGERIRNEIESVLVEDNAPAIVQLLGKYGVFETISTAWKEPSTFTSDFHTAQAAISWASEHITDAKTQPQLIRWMTFFGLDQTHGSPEYAIEALCFRLALNHQLRRISNSPQALQKEFADEVEIRCSLEKAGITLSQDTWFDYRNGKWCIADIKNEATYIVGDGKIYGVQSPIAAYRKLSPILAAITEATEPSAIYQHLNPFPLEAIVLACCNQNLSDIQRKKIEDYLLNLRKIQPIINGNDLIKWGEKPSKSFQSILKNIFMKQLDGEIKTKSDGYACYRQQIDKEKD